MDPTSKKRKSDENGAPAAPAAPAAMLSTEDARKILATFTQEQLLTIVADAMSGGDAVILDAVRAVADLDPAQRKIFVRGLGWNTNGDGLRVLFSAYGEVEEAVVIADKATGRSKGYGFVTFLHTDGALLALKEPSKPLDGRMTVSQLAAAGNSALATPAVDISLRKIYVGGVHPELSANLLLDHFTSYGEIEEGPLGFDKLTGKSKGFALFVYKTAEGANSALAEPTKIINGYQMTCKIANEGKRGIPVGPVTGPPAGTLLAQQMGPRADFVREGLGQGPPSSLQSSLSNPYGVPSGHSSYGAYPGGVLSGGGMSQHHQNVNSSLPSSIGTGNTGLSSIGSQVPPFTSGGSRAGGYESGPAGPYGQNTQYPIPSSGGYRGFEGEPYRAPLSSSGVPSSAYPESGRYDLSSSVYQSQQHQYRSQHQQQSIGSPGARVSTGGGMYPNKHY